MIASTLCLWCSLAVGQVASSAAPAESSWLEVVPADVDALVRVRGAESVKNDLAKMLDAMSPTLADIAKPALEAGLTSFAGQYGEAATKGPFVVLMRLPKEDGELPPYAVIVKSDNYGGVQKSVAGGGEVKPVSKGAYDEINGPENKKLYTYKGKGFVAFGESESLVGAIARPKSVASSSWNADLKSRFFRGDLGIYVSLASIQKRFGPQIDAARQQFLGAIEQAPVGNDKMRDSIKSLYAGMFDAIKVADALVLSFDFDASGLTLAGEVTVKADSPRGQRPSEPQPVRGELITKLPSDNSTFMDLDLNPDELIHLKRLGMMFVFGSSGKGSPEIEKALDQAMKACDGEIASAISYADGYRAVSVMTPKDPKAAMSALMGSMKVFATSKDRGAFDIFKEMAVNSTTEKYRGFEFHRVDMTLDMEKVAKLQPGSPAAADAVKKLFGGEKISSWIGSDGKLILSASAATWEKAKVQIDAVVSGSGTIGQSPAYAAVRKKLPDRVNALALMSAQGVVRQIADSIASAVPGAAAAKPGELPKEPAFFGGSLTAVPKGYHFDLVVPSAVGPVFEKGLAPMIQGLQGKVGM
jgi:hypothetical protein